MTRFQAHPFSPSSRGKRFRLAVLLLAVVCFWPAALSRAQQAPAADQPAAGDGAAGNDSKDADATGASPQPEAGSAANRTQLNLAGQTNEKAGESRRNENVQFNLIDNNALKELQQRLGATATLIEEFTPDKNYFGSEFGGAPEGPIHLSPIGRQSLHGQLYYGHLNSVLSARSFFQVGDVKPARENEYGFAVSLPAWKGGFFTLNGGQHKIRGQVNGNILIPLPEERSPLTTDPALAAFVMKIFSAYPDEPPNRTDIDPRMLNTNSPQSINNDNAGGRFDQKLSERDSLAASYSFVNQFVQAFQLVKGQNPDTETKSHSAAVTWTRAWSADTLTDFSAAFDRIHSLLTPDPNYIGMRASVSSVLQQLGPGNSIPIDRAQNDFKWAGQLRLTRGRHQLTVGAGGLRRQLNGVESDSAIGNFQFHNDSDGDALTKLRLGKPNAYFKSIGYINRAFRLASFQGYVGDKWQANGKLTIDVGLRYELQAVPHETRGLNTFPFGTDANNFAPMAGFAYRLNGRWGVVRAGYGIHYSQIYPVTLQQTRFNAPLNLKLVLTNPDPLDPLAGINAIDPSQVRPVLYEFVPDLVNPYTHLYDFLWEVEPVTGWRLTLGYVGSRSLKLLQRWYLNRAHPVDGVATTTDTIDQRRADPRYTDIRRVENTSRGYFDAAKVTLTVPRWRGLTAEVSYWFSKALDLGSNYTNTAQDKDSVDSRSQSEYDIHADLKALSDFDQPNAFLARASYALPHPGPPRGWANAVFGGWTVSTVVLLKTGTPFSLETGSDAPNYGNVDGTMNDRPNVVDPTVLGRTIGNPDTSTTLLPRSAFSFIRLGDERGNLGKNTFRKGPIRNVNAAMMKSWTLGGEKQLMFRAESVNLFNTPQFAEPGMSLTDPNFGRITNTLNDGRTFRGLLQFQF